MKVALFFLVPIKQLGGCTSFTAHLARSLVLLGHSVDILRIGKKPRSGVNFAYGLTSRTVTMEQARTIARTTPSLIAYCFWKKMNAPCSVLLRMGVPIVMHDPAEFYQEWADIMRRFDGKALVIRKRNIRGLRELGVDSVYVPHPYAPSGVQQALFEHNAVSIARVDFRKRTHVICQANRIVGPDLAVRLYGEMNRIYVYHQLSKQFPEWRQWYHGMFDDRVGEAVEIARSARLVVDLTAIKGDGGGTQYTFFEAWEADRTLVLNKAWFTSNRDEVREGVNCLAIGNAQELADVLRSQDEHEKVREGGRRTLKAHLPEATIPQYLEMLNAS